MLIKQIFITNFASITTRTLVTPKKCDKGSRLPITFFCVGWRRSGVVCPEAEGGAEDRQLRSGDRTRKQNEFLCF